MDFFETTAKYAYRQSLKILTWRDLAVAFTIFIVSLLVGVIMRKQKGWKWKTVSYFSLLFPYIYLGFAITVISRQTVRNPRVELMPFWSYIKALRSDSKILLWECALNVFMFVPLGIGLQGLGVRKLKWVILIAVIISYSIEFSQLLTKRGLFELFDDPFHNVLGAIIGFTLWRMIMKRCSEKSEGQAIRQK